jgi:ParB family chromosome partitioning protein
MAKKPYTLPEDFSSNTTRTLSMAEKNLSLERHQFIPINLIEFDPHNPRQLSITREDVLHGIKTEDCLYDKKVHEYEEILKPLSDTIKKVGLLSPIQVFRKKDKYRLIHGECRCLASMIAKQDEIKAFICQKEPNEYEIKFLQLVENVFRKNLNLYEKLKNIEAVYTQYKNHIDEKQSLNSAFIMNSVCCSLAQAKRISSVLNGPEFLMSLIKDGKVKNLKVASKIAVTQDPSLREQFIKEANKGLSIEKLERISSINKNDIPVKTGRVGRRTTRINMGYTKNKDIIKKLCDIVLSSDEYLSFKHKFQKINWDNLDDCTLAFKNLISIVEKA